MAIIFDGVDDSAYINSGLVGGYPFSFSVWVWVASGTVDNGAFFWIGDKDQDDEYCEVRLNNTGTIQVVSRITGNVQFKDGTIDIRGTGWRNIIGIFASASDRRVYLDGNIEITDTASVNFTSVEDKTGIGGSLDSTPSYATYKESDVALWSREISLKEIEILQSGVKRIPLQITQGLVGYWPLDDISNGLSADGVSLKDISGNGNHFTGDDGANNTGLTGLGEKRLTYQ